MGTDSRYAVVSGWKDGWLRGGMAGAGTERNGTDMDGWM